MQTLWARAAQVRGSCRCPQCLSSVNGVSRRATGTATRRMPRYLTSSTLWFSGIFATAATFDAAMKMRRREQWDVAIAGVKQELRHEEVGAIRRGVKEEEERLREDMLSFRPFDSIDEGHVLEQADTVAMQFRGHEHEDAQGQNTDAMLSPKLFSEEGELQNGLSDGHSHQIPPLGPTNAEATQDIPESQAARVGFQPFLGEQEEHDVFRDVDSDRPRPHWPANTGRTLNVDRLPPQSIYASQERKALWSNSVPVAKKLAAIQMAIEMLQLTIFLELGEQGWGGEAAKAVPESFAKHILRDRTEQRYRLETKKAAWCELLHTDSLLNEYVPRDDDVRLCDFSQDRTPSLRKSLSRLHQSFRELFDRHANEEISRAALYAKIAYNLSVCPAAPNVTTFNTLLLGFSRLGDRAIVDPLIAYIRRANVRMNEVTLAAILRHYTQTNQPNNFATWIKLMRGKNGGLMLARGDFLMNETSEGRLIPHENDPSKVVQLPYPTPYVFKAVIEGVLRFCGFNSALSICQNMGTDGWGLCISGLTPLLQDCAARADWQSGSAIWKQIQALKLSSKRREGATLMSERIKSPTFAAMLMLCSKCRQWDDFNVVWNEAVRVHIDLPTHLEQTVRQQEEEAEVAMRRDQAEAELPEWHDNEDYFVLDPHAPTYTTEWLSIPGLGSARSQDDVALDLRDDVDVLDFRDDSQLEGLNESVA